MATELNSNLSPSSQMAADRMDLAIERAVSGSPLYPSGTAFVGADLPRLGELLAGYAREHRPVVIVYPDGEERLTGPWPNTDDVGNVFSRLFRRLSARPSRP